MGLLPTVLLLSLLLLLLLVLLRCNRITRPRTAAAAAAAVLLLPCRQPQLPEQAVYRLKLWRGRKAGQQAVLQVLQVGPQTSIVQLACLQSSQAAGGVLRIGRR